MSNRELTTQPARLALFAAVSLCVAGAGSLNAEPLGPNLDVQIEAALVDYHIPGVSACVVRHGEIVWQGAYGLADIDQDIPVTNDTPFAVASISKTMICAAVMQLEEDQLLSLTDDVNDHLPFSVRNPAFPNDPITIEMLLTHSSSITDDWNVLLFLTSCGEDSPIPLATFMEEYLTPTGLYYGSNVYQATAPGVAPMYTNVGAALAAAIVETVSGEPFPDYCAAHVFDPVGMPNATWSVTAVGPVDLAVPYYYNPTSGEFEAYMQYSEPWYPSAQLKTTAPELARFLIAMMQGGEIDGVRILDEATVQSIFTVNIPEFQEDVDMGLIWARGQWLGRAWWGQSGEYYGVSTMMRFSEEHDLGVIVLTNTRSPTGTEHIGELIFTDAATAASQIAGAGVTSDAPTLRVSPNPFRRDTELRFRIPTDSRVRIDIFDVRGRRVARVVDGAYVAGPHRVLWTATSLPAGAYFARIEGSQRSSAHKVTVLH